MTERKFTDDEVIRALECCYTNDSNDCYKCPYTAESTAEMFCDKKLIKDALDLIKRQRAELKALKMDNDQLQSDIVNATMNLESVQHELDKARAEIERLNYCRETNISSIAELHRRLLTAKTEAIKEFAERLKEIKVKYALPLLGLQTKTEIESYVDDILLQMRDGIDRLVKEMTEGEQ